MRVRFTAITIGAVLAVSLVLGPPGSVASEPAPAPAPATQPRADKTVTPKACYLDDHRPCSVTKKYGKRWAKKIRQGKIKKLKNFKRAWRGQWKHPRKAKRKAIRALRRGSREFRHMRAARVWRKFSRDTYCGANHPVPDMMMCRPGMDGKGDDNLPGPVKATAICGGAAVIFLIGKGKGLNVYFRAAGSCSIGVWLKELWS